MIFFLIIGSSVTIVSLIISNKTPEQQEFVRRATSLANSDEAQKNLHVKLFLLKFLNNFSFYKVFICSMTINKFNSETNAFLVFLQREQILCNMYKDREYIKMDSSISVETDIEVNGSYGNLNYVKVFDTKTNEIIHPDCDETSEILLAKGLNARVFPIIAPPNSEVGLKFGYNAWQKTGNKDDKSNWIFFRAATLATGIKIILLNNFQKEPINYELQQFSYEDNRIKLLQKGQLHLNAPIKFEKPDIYLYPGDKIECYIS